ncbi:sterol desaturase family protein [Aspergillus candidus]|uniref:Fatty acid hydroxylase domain-containing protein n=1 Tax=Aspergillus candidus TaxID=41067 RepID=A0A2I2FIG8_ASPCN|nr:hypothetical protein BDW47DRAFT_134806 [Aspergillus candidus]PLB40425.1 hypothetical protein BDW47DRAFT_134806 [Aspergillus candidus]
MTGSYPQTKTMKSTTHLRIPPRGDQIFHSMFEMLQIRPITPSKTVPIHQKPDKVRYIPQWQLHRWLVFYGCVIFAAHHLYAWWVGRNLTPLSAFLYYSAAHSLVSLHGLRILCRLGHTLGYLESWKRPRDDVPVNQVNRIMLSLISMYFVRPILPFYFTYHPYQLPLPSISWWRLFPAIGTYSLVLDFWFYWYHRAMHEVRFLRRYHRAHHASHHPSTLLLVSFDAEEGLFNIVVIPLLTWLSLRAVGWSLGFYEWWVCNGYVAFSEFGGHGGLRVYAPAPSPFNPVLQGLGAELIMEDHDVHHRLGWGRSSGNYGKLTRVWDCVFGTCLERIECVEGNIDFDDPVALPIF